MHTYHLLLASPNLFPCQVTNTSTGLLSTFVRAHDGVPLMPDFSRLVGADCLLVRFASQPAVWSLLSRRHKRCSVMAKARTMA